MPYRLTARDRSVRAGLRRIAAEQAAKGAAALGDAALDEEVRVHEARKAIKKLRGLMRLARGGLDRRAEEDRLLRDLGRSLAPLRDADVGAALLAELAGQAGLAPELRRSLAERLVAAQRPGDGAERMAAAQVVLEGLAARAAGWSFDGRGFALMEPGLRRGWAEARTLLDAVRDDPTAERLHDWRKRLKDHGYQARLLVGIWPEAVALHVQVARRLSDLLGAHQDLAVLAGRLAEAEGAAPVLALAAKRRRALLAEAVPLGRRFLAEPPKALAKRWRRWWAMAPGFPDR